MKRLMVAATALALGACVGNKVELGGYAKPVTPPSDAEPCDGAGLHQVSRGRFQLTEDVYQFFAYAENGDRLAQMALAFDITSKGEPVNLHYVGDPADTKHSAKQKLIAATARMIEDSRWAWAERPGFALNCVYRLDYAFRMQGQDTILLNLAPH